MSKFFGGLVVLAFVVFGIAKNPSPYKKLVRDAVGVEQPTPEQVEWKQAKDRLDRGSQVPTMSMPADEARKRMREILEKGSSTENN